MRHFALCLAVFLIGEPASAGMPQESRMNVIPSWGDMTLVYGPGTDAAMDSPEAIEGMIKHWKGRGFTGVYLRTDLAQIESFIERNTVTTQNPTLAVAWDYIDTVMNSFPADFHQIAQAIADRHDFEFWSWHPHIYSDGAPPEVGVPGVGRMIPWSYVANYTAQHPDVITIDRAGNPFWMVREYAYPGARTSKVAEFVHMAEELRLKRFVACMRSEATQVLPPPDKADQYGFNSPVVDDMKKRYNVDILTDPRFDVYREDFDLLDPMVENWRNLRGEYVTDLYRELRLALRAVDPDIRLAVTLSGEYAGPILGNWRMDWRTWVDEGLIDEIVLPVTFEATLDLELAAKGYLTSARHAQGIVPLETAREYIAQSAYPDIKLISSGAPAYFYESIPKGADGWRCDVWYDSYHLAWYQRWGQFMRDLEAFGHIRFLAQNFDAFPAGSQGHAGGLGALQYVPELRAAPGVWSKFGQGDNAQPLVQSDTRRGTLGNAVRLTSAADGSGSLSGWHVSSPDRSKYTSSVDVAIANGTCTYEFWLLRESAGSSIAAYLQGDIAYETDVALHIAPGTGRLSYREGSQWISSDYDAPVGTWVKYTMAVNLDEGSYSAFAGGTEVLCQDIGYAPLEKRYVVLHGVNTPIEVPVYRVFNYVSFVPEGPVDTVTYLDDIQLTWRPALHFTDPGDIECFSDDFETYDPGDPFAAQSLSVDGRWRLDSDMEDRYIVENSTSYGPGVQCLRAKGGAAVKSEYAVPADSGGMMTIDFDIFIRSDKSYPYIVPDPTTKSASRTSLSIGTTDSDSPAAGVSTGDGVWAIWDGDRYVDSSASVAYDVWNHVQIAKDTSTGRYRVVVQPVGELPTLVGEATVGISRKTDSGATLQIAPSANATHLSCYDNISVRCRNPDR
jgi:hypothetical protein